MSTSIGMAPMSASKPMADCTALSTSGSTFWKKNCLGTPMRSRNADGAAGVSPERRSAFAGCDGGPGAGAGATGDSLQVPRVSRGPVVRVHAGRTESELVQIQLAQDDRSGRFETGRSLGVV